MSLKITRTDYGDVTVLELEGRITLGEGATYFRNTVKETLQMGRLKLVIVYAGVSFVDSAGNGEIVTAYTYTRNAGGMLVLAGIPKGIRDLMQITKLFTVFETFETIPDAVAYLAN